MYEDSADSRAYEDLFGAMFAHHPTAFRSPERSNPSVRSPRQVLQDCHAAFYAPANLMLCVTGDVDPALVEEIAVRSPQTPQQSRLPVRVYGRPRP